MTEVLLQPTVFFQIADHRRRLLETCETNQQRVMGCLIGIKNGSKLIINNSFAVPFSESQGAYYIDIEYAKVMADMFKKVYSDEFLVGYYTTSPQFKVHDSELAQKILDVVGPTIRMAFSFQGDKEETQEQDDLTDASKNYCYLLNVNCLEGDDLSPFYKLYRISNQDSETRIAPEET